MKLRIPSSEKLLRIACVLALVALGLIVWSLFDPGVAPIMVSMSIGQALGTLSFVAYLVVVGRDIYRTRHSSSRSMKIPAQTGSQPASEEDPPA